MPSFITDAEVEKALFWLAENAGAAAKARAERLYVEDYARVLKARLMSEHNNLSAVLQERQALSDPRFQQHLEVIRTAVEVDERNRFLRSAAEAKIEAWRTMAATERAMKL